MNRQPLIPARSVSGPHRFFIQFGVEMPIINKDRNRVQHRTQHPFQKVWVFEKRRVTTGSAASQ
jgi:hypothetical protein